MNSLLLSLLISTSMLSHPRTTKTSTDSIKNKQIGEVTVYSNLSKTLALPMVVVDKKSLESSSFVTPADVLQRETGISLFRDGIWSTSVNVRGLSEQRLLFLVDGDRIQTATDVAGSLSTVNMSSLDRIEVIKGACSVLYGSGAMGGVVNLIPERPTYNTTKRVYGQVGTELNSANMLWSNNAKLNYTGHNWYVGLNGSFRTAGDTRTPDGKISGSQFHDASWNLVAGVKYSPTEEFIATYQHVNAWDVGIPGGSVFPKTASVQYKDITRNQMNVEYIITRNDRALREIRVKAYTQNLTRDVENITSATMRVLPSSNNKTWGGKITGNWRSSENQNLLLGIEGWQRKAETIRLKVKTVNDSTLNVTGELPTPRADVIDFGAFGHYSWKIVPGKWTFNAGARVDYFRTKNDTLMNPVFQYVSVNDRRTFAKTFPRKLMFNPATHYDPSYSVHFDLVYSISSQHQLSLSVSNSYRIASLEERFKYIDQEAGILRIGNPKLSPEKGYFANLNYTLSVNRFSLKADAFVNYLTDLITEKLDPLYPSALKVYVNTNVNRALFTGGELETNWDIQKNLRFTGNVSYTRARDLDNDSYLPQIPPLHGFVSLTYALKRQVEAVISAQWAARQSNVAPNEAPTNGYICLNADARSAKYKISRNSSLLFFAGVENLLDKAYYNHLTTSRGIIRLEPGRNIYFRTRLEW